jgi:hypothetical protein
VAATNALQLPQHITIDSVNDWVWRKRQAGCSWTVIKDALRTMQRILSAFSKDKKPPFSQRGLAVPERDRLDMKIKSRKKVTFSWEHAVRIFERVRKTDDLRSHRRIVGSAKQRRNRAVQKRRSL